MAKVLFGIFLGAVLVMFGQSVISYVFMEGKKKAKEELIEKASKEMIENESKKE